MTDLDALRWVETADVYKGEVRAASLTRTAQGTRFAYRDEYAGPAVATTLPLGTVVELAGGALPAFFSGLLPEGRRLTALRGAIKTSLDDELTLLLAVGGDLIGDVRVLPAGADPASVQVSHRRSSWPLATRSDCCCSPGSRATGTRTPRISL